MNKKIEFYRFYSLVVCVLMMIFWAPTSAVAQTLKVKGTVVSSSDNLPLVGVAISVQGSSKGTISDANGSFSLSGVKSGNILEFSYIGFKDQTVSVTSKTNINVSMVEDIAQMDEVVVIGYGTQRKREITGAISSVKGEDLTKLGGSSFADALQGQMAGVNVQATSGAPGSGTNIQIRGIGSFSSGALSPLYVVDGMPYGGAPNIAANEIESIEVLKDAASASIYGTRASNGVILITTKRGAEGKMNVELDSYYGIQNITSGIELMDTKGYLYTYMLKEELNNSPGSLIYSPLWSNPTGLKYDTNWMEQLTVDNAPIQNHALTVSGGQKGLTYNLTATYFSQDGSMINSDYERFSVRANTTYEKNRFSAFVSTSMNIDDKDVMPWGLSESAITTHPMNPPLDPDSDTGLALGEAKNEAAGMINNMREENTENANGFNIHADFGYKLTDSWSIHLTGGLGRSTNKSRNFKPTYLLYNEKGELQSSSRTESQLSEGFSFATSYSTEFITSYERVFDGGHSLKLFAAASAEKSTWDSRQGTQTGFPSNSITTPSAGTGTASYTGSNSTNTLAGLVARAIYNFNDRYIVSASVRRDGSSKFGLNKWATFPSASIGWGVSEEPYFKEGSISNVMSTLKFRASMGTAGNQSIPSYKYDPTVQNNLDYVLGGDDQSNVMKGAATRGFSNPVVQWETSVSRNIGIDFGFFDDALIINADYYHTDKKDMLLPVAVAPSSGAPAGDWQYGNVQLNAGDMYNKGIELAATYRGHVGDFMYSVMGTFSKNKNMVVKTYVPSNYLSGGSPGGRSNEPTTYVKEGYPAGAFFLVKNLGTIKTEKQLEAYREYDNTAELGDLWLCDANGDMVINDDDRVFCGSGTPDWEAGLTLNLGYKNFDFNMQFYGTYGNKVYNGSKLLAYVRTRHQDLVYMWTPENPTSNVPTARKELEHNNTRNFNEYYLEDGSYLRLRNVQLGYTLPTSLVKRVGINKLRVYVSAQNPLTFTAYTGYDPEIGGDGIFSKGVDSSTYPVCAQYRLGLQLNF